MVEHDDSRESPKTVRIEIFTTAEGDDEVRIRDVTHVRDLIRFAAELDDRERAVQEREEQAAAGLRAEAESVVDRAEPEPDDQDRAADLDELATRLQQRSTRDKKLVEAEERLRAGFKELEGREAELESRMAVAEADLELREDE